MTTKLLYNTPGELKRAIKNINYHPGKIRRFLRKAYWALFVYYFRSNHVSTVLTRNGLLHYESRDRTVGRILEVYRHFDFHDIEATATFLNKIGVLNGKPEGVVVDVGGFLGMSSITFLHENIFSGALAFEPNPTSFELLKKNVSDNFLEDRITYHNIALSDENGILEFELSNSNYGDHRIRNRSDNMPGHYAEESRKTISVESSKFDDIIKKESGINPQDIKLIWMDTQGHEGRFLRGAKEFILSHPHVPTIMEFWPYAILRSGMSKAGFLETVQDIYSHFFKHTPDGFIEHDINDLGTIFDRTMSPSEWGTLLLLNKTEGINF